MTWTRIFASVLLIVAGLALKLNAQNNALILNGAVYTVLNGGTSSTPVYLVINQSNPSGITRTTGHVISENQYNYIRWLTGTTTGNFVLPFGYGITDYLPLTINKTSSGSTTIDASTWGTDNKNLPHAGVSNNGAIAANNQMLSASGDSISSVIDRWWDIYSPSPLVADLTFSYRGVENSTTSNTGDNLDIQRWNGARWDRPLTGSSTGVTSGVGTLSVASATSFSPFVIVHRTGILPVTLIDFKAQCIGDAVKINWVTASEENSDYFTIEKSINGENFQPIARLKAAGNSIAIKKYELIDKSAGNFGYYRLKEFDFDGKFSYSSVIHVACQKSESPNIKIYPNPTSNYINCDVVLKAEGSVTFEIFDDAGHQVFEEAYYARQGMNTITTDVRTLSVGLYLLVIKYEDKTSKIKFTRMNQ